MLAAVSCDRPSGPTITAAKPAPPTAKPTLPSSMLRERFQQVLVWNHLYPRDSLTIERDGHVERYVATVVEREFLPDKAAAGGQPFVRRLLIAWNGDLHRGFVITSNDSVSRVSPRTFRFLEQDSSSAPPWERLALVDASADDGRERWTGTSGDVRFVLGTRIGECPPMGPHDRQYVDVRSNIEWLASYSACGRYRYRVSVSAEAEKPEAARSSSSLSRWFSRPMSIRIPEQELPGTRIVEPCLGDDAWQTGCDLFNFWRSPSDFAALRRKGVPLDFNRLQKTDPWSMAFYQTVSPGNGALFSCCERYTGPVKYTLYAPSGRVLREATLASAREDTLFKYIPSLEPSGPFLRYGSRTLFYVRARPYRSTVIMDLTLLPCPEDPPAASGLPLGQCIRDRSR